MPVLAPKTVRACHTSAFERHVPAHVLSRVRRLLPWEVLVQLNPTSEPRTSTDSIPTDNVADLVRTAAETDPDHPAVVEAASGHRLSWGALDASVDAAAAAFAAAEVHAGDRVVVRLPGAISYCIAVFGALRAGAVVVPVGRGAAPHELAEVLTGSGAAVLVAGTDDDLAAETADRAGALLLAPPEPVDPADDPVPPFATQGCGEDLAVLAFTSGTSGTARGVMLSHRALLANVTQCARLRPAPVTAADRVLLALPLFHVYGLGPGLLQIASAGATAVLAGRFDAAESLAAIRRHRVTTVVGLPPMYRAWLKLGDDQLRAGFRTVRLLTSGAAPLDRALTEAFRNATGLGIFEGYGLTETGPVLTWTLVGGVPKPGSVGRPIPGVELRLVDSDGTPLGPGDAGFGEDDEDDAGTGFVAARGDNLFTGYWPSGEGGPDAQGWFRTGDVGFLDADGDLHLVDRASDLIIVSGFNVYPHEVERALLEHPAIAQAGVVGMPHEDTGETVRALLVLTGGATLSAAELAAHLVPRLARYKIPTVVEVVDELPVTATGKLARRTLRTLHGHSL
jgi:long-chain acyl-CoA synthetase